MLKKSFLIIIALIFSILTCNLYAEEKIVKLATDPWAPFYHPELKNNGFISDIVTQAFKKSGYRLEISFIPWSRAVSESKKGNYDGLLGAFHTKEREKYYFYSNPISSTSLVFFTIKERDIHYKELSDLKNYQIGTIRGYTYSKEFDNADYLHKQEVRSVDMNINKLIRGRIDMFIDSRSVVLHTLKTKFSDKSNLLKIVEPPLKVNYLYVPISKKSKNAINILSALNKGLKAIIDEGTYYKINEAHGF